jgi:ribose transport system substrate-binding protein
MKKAIIIILLLAGCVVTLSASVYYSYRVFQGNDNVSFNNSQVEGELYRIVYIAQELGSPFWNNVQAGAERVAEENAAVIDFWGTYRPNLGELLKSMEIATASKVSGIIVQGTESPEFVEAVNKASAKGIPVITIATDAPKSLRKTYVGSDHFREGLAIGEQVAKQLNGSGKVAVVAGSDPTSNQELRQKGIAEVLSAFPEVEIVEVYSFGNPMHAREETNEILNRHPNCKVFIGLSAESGLGIIQTIRTRAKLSDYMIYTFEDSPETLQLVKQGIISATLSHRPEDMGEVSMSLMLKWLEGKDLPLERNYYTPSRMISKEDFK